MIERSQFLRNDPCYLSGFQSVLPARLKNSKQDENMKSMLHFFLSETEMFQGKLGRYSSPEEHAFFPTNLKSFQDLPTFTDSTMQHKIKPNAININERINYVYMTQIIPKMCKEGVDEQNYGSTCWCDIAVLQAMSKRIHYGKFVAEAKFQLETEKFTELILNNDSYGLMEALTHETVEKLVIERVLNKASHYGTDGTTPAYKVDPELISTLYEEFLIPLNKDVQVQYLLQRLDRPNYAYSNTNDPFFEKAQIAGLSYFGKSSSGLECKTISEVFLSVLNNKVAFGVVPIENTAKGLNKETQQSLLQTKLKVFCSVLVENERYFVISKHTKDISKDINRIVILFETLHQPGSLLLALKSLEGFNMCCLESTPSKDNYVFYCEFDVKGISVDTIKEGFSKLTENTKNVDIVGCYFV